MKPTRFLAAVLLLAGPAFAQSKGGAIEITPFGGANLGGRLYAGSTAIFSRDVDVDVSGTYGLRVGATLNRWFGVEGNWSRAEGDIEPRSGDELFAPGRKLGKLRVDQYGIDGVFSFGHRRVIPYVALGFGATTFRATVPDFETSTDTRFAATSALGVKVFATPNIGFRFEGRGRATYINDRGRCDRHYTSYCDDNRNRYDDDSTWYSSGDVTGALVFRF